MVHCGCATQDVRVKLRQTRLSAWTLFAVDASGSMAAQRRMAAAKGAVVALLTRAYQQRNEVGLIAFRGRSAELVLPPTNRLDLAYARLRDLPTGGRTPLAAALRLALDTLLGHRREHRSCWCWSPTAAPMSAWRRRSRRRCAGGWPRRCANPAVRHWSSTAKTGRFASDWRDAWPRCWAVTTCA